MKQLLIVGDGYGVPELLEFIPHHKVRAIIAASNRPQYHSDLEKIASDLGVSFLMQPLVGDKAAYAQFVHDVKKMSPDGLFSHSYSMLVRPDILHLVEGRAFNVHAALLPRNRGPNPVQWALIHGEDKTGVTLHVMDNGIDSGAIVDQKSIAISDKDTWVSLMERVRSETRELLKRAIPRLLDGRWTAKPQDAHMATTNKRISRDSFRIDFSSMSDRDIFNLIRAQVEPLAGAYVETREGQIRFKSYMLIDDVASLRARYAHG